MKNQAPEELMRNVLSDGYTLTEDIVVLLMKMYANGKLNLASENAILGYEDRWPKPGKIIVDKQSILKLKDLL